MKRNNRGFSLVELIIVIAIMAILVAVLAPQYLRYVDRARYSKDVQTIDQVYSVVLAAIADPDILGDIDSDIVISFKLPGEGELQGSGAEITKHNLPEGMHADSKNKALEALINQLLASEDFTKDAKLTCRNYKHDKVSVPSLIDKNDVDRPAIVIYQNGSAVEYIPEYGRP